jgi:tRNA1(Val) A37 N6-methylase TrmN6
MRLVYSDNLSDAQFALVEGKRGSKEELKVKSPLFIYDRDKNYSQEMTGIFKELSGFPAAGGG